MGSAVGTVLVGVVGVVACLAVACGGGGPADDGAAGDDATSPVPGGELAYALEAETTGGFCLSDSQLAVSGMMVVRAIYDTLTIPSGEGEIVPNLAESVEPNDDFTEWTITLREGITFHDGTALDATVVKNNLDAYLGRYPGRTSLLFVFVLDEVDTVEVVDDLTVKVTTEVSWPAFPAYLYGGSRLGIMAQAQLDDPDTCDRNLIGTGPFVLEEWAINQSLSATKNPDYWQTDDDGTPLPYLDRIEFRPVMDGDTRVNGLLSDQFGVIHTSGATQIAPLRQEAESGTVDLTETLENTEVNYLMMNASKPPFDDVVARRAIAHALDRDLYNQVVGQGIYEMATGPYAPGAPGYLEDPGFPEFDLGEATALVEQYEAESGEPFEFTLVHANDNTTLASVQFVQEQLSEAGITVNLRPLEQSALINAALGDDWNMIPFRNLPSGVPDGNYVWFYGGSPVNFTKFDDPEINDLMDRGRQELDQDAAVEIYEEVNRELASEVYFEWLEWTPWTIATQPEVHGVFGPTLPGGQPPSETLATGHSVTGLWVEP